MGDGTRDERSGMRETQTRGVRGPRTGRGPWHFLPPYYYPHQTALHLLLVLPARAGRPDFDEVLGRAVDAGRARSRVATLTVSQLAGGAA